MASRRIRISFRMDRVMVIRRRGACSRAWCKDCASVVNFLTPKEAASVAGVTTRVIYQWLEAGKLHYSETADGETLICLDSLLRGRA
jgi:excisionase family DNA binding protein